MKVKVKITVDQFQYLLSYIQGAVNFDTDKLRVLNIRLFIKYGFKKMIDLKSEPYNTAKPKTFSVEINQYISLMSFLTNERNNLEPYTLAIYLTLQNQNKSLLSLSNG